MPTYEYACRDCGQHVEVVQSFTDAPLSTCGLCGGHLRKVFSAAGIIFKGSGYYVTDSRSNGKRTGDKSKTKTDDTTGDGKASTSDNAGSSDSTTTSEAKSA